MRREHAHDTVGSFRTQLQSLRAPSMLLPRRIPCPCGHASLPCNECPPHALGPIPPRLGSLRSPRALKRACCLGKPCQWPITRLTHASHPTLPIKRHTYIPFPMQWVLSPRTRPLYRLVKELSSPWASMLPWKNVPITNVTARARGSPMPPAQRYPYKGTRMSPIPDVAHQKVHGCLSPPCNECPPHVLGLVSACRGALDRACCLGKTCQWAMLRSPRGLTHAFRPMLPIERHMDALPSPPVQWVPFPRTRQWQFLIWKWINVPMTIFKNIFTIFYYFSLFFGQKN